MVRVISFEVVQLPKTTLRNTNTTANLFIIKSIIFTHTLVCLLESYYLCRTKNKISTQQFKLLKYLPRIIHLLLGGFCAIGQYSRAENTTSPTMQKLREEVESYSRRTDKQALLRDATMNATDARKSFNKIIAHYGEKVN